jgi:AcrR family transcriptional regulator
VGRWEPDARGRLEEAAAELYAERGFDEATVADVAGRAGLTERTFFRHFADKRDVLFSGSEGFQNAFVQPVIDAPRSSSPVEAVVAGMASAGSLLQANRSPEFARRRARIIAASAELRERELMKFATLASALSDVLRQRGLSEPAASLLSEVATSLFRVAFDRWIEESNQRGLTELITESLDQLRELLR